MVLEETWLGEKEGVTSSREKDNLNGPERQFGISDGF